MRRLFLFLSHQCEAIAEWQHHLLDAFVGSHGSVEGVDGLRLRVAKVRLFDDMTIPKCIICQDKGARRGMLHGEFVVGGILTLVAVDEDEVERLAQRGDDLQRIADDEFDAVADARLLYPRPCEILQFIVNLEVNSLSSSVNPSAMQRAE